MTLVKWKRPIDNGHSSNQLFYNSPFSTLFENFLNDDFVVRETASFMPAINVIEEKDKFLLDLSAPGFEKENIRINVEKGVLVISGEKKEENEHNEPNYKRKEFNYGSFRRSFTLPENVDENKISAKYENGILKISILKDEKEKINPVKQILIS